MSGEEFTKGVKKWGSFTLLVSFAATLATAVVTAIIIGVGKDVYDKTDLILPLKAKLESVDKTVAKNTEVNEKLIGEVSKFSGQFETYNDNHYKNLRRIWTTIQNNHYELQRLKADCENCEETVKELKNGTNRR